MEKWRDIICYEGLYQVSSMGRVKSFHSGNEYMLKQNTDSRGYSRVSLCKDGNKKDGYIHQLVAVAFLNHTPCGYVIVVNHKDFNKLNNDIGNLELVSNRENTNKRHIKSSSKYTGVSWSKQDRVWKSQLVINGDTKYLGRFKSEFRAHLAYQYELLNIVPNARRK